MSRYRLPYIVNIVIVVPVLCVIRLMMGLKYLFNFIVKLLKNIRAVSIFSLSKKSNYLKLIKLRSGDTIRHAFK